MRVASLAAAIALGGCVQFGEDRETELRRQQQQEERMRSELHELLSVYQASVESTGRAIAAGTPDVEVKRRSVFFRMWMIYKARESLWRPLGPASFVDIWTFVVQFDAFLRDGVGRDIFADQQEVAIQGVAVLLASIEARYEEDVEPEAFERAKADVYEFAAKNPLEDLYGRDLRPAPTAEGGGLFTWMPTVSLDPFSGVSEGLSTGVVAVHEMRRAADRLIDVVEFLPMQIGWQLELAQYGAARQLPDVAKQSVAAAFEALDPHLANVRETLADATAVAATFDKAWVSFSQTARDVESTARQLDVTLAKFDETLGLLIGEPDATPAPAEAAASPDASRPFDILDIDRSARSIEAASADLRSTLVEFNQLVGSKALDGRIEQVDATTRSLIWTGAMALGAVIVAFFGALLAYRRLSASR